MLSLSPYRIKKISFVNSGIQKKISARVESLFMRRLS